MPLEWGTQSDWENASKNNIEVVNDTIQLATAIPDSGVSRWEFEQNVNDSWGSFDAIDGSSAGYSTEAEVGEYSKLLDGTDDYIEVDHNYSTFENSDFSITGWAKFDALHSNNVIFAGEDGGNAGDGDTWWFVGYSDLENSWQVQIDEGGGNKTVSSGSTPSTGTWYFISWIVTAGGGTELYIDANSDLTTGYNDFNASSHSLYFGNNGRGENYLNGHIDDIRVYNKALSGTEVSNLYNTGSING